LIQVPDFGYTHSNIAYTAAGQLQIITYGSGLQAYRSKFNPYQRPESLLVYATEPAQRQYYYTSMGRLASLDWGDMTHDFIDRWYAYDARGRLTRYVDTRFVVVDSAQDDCDPEQWCDPDRPWNYGWDTPTLRDVSFS